MTTASEAYRLVNPGVFMDRNVFSFYVILPIIIGAVFAFSQSGSEPLRGVTGYLAYWLVSVFVIWQLLALGSKVAATVLRPLRAPLILVLLVGFVLGTLLWMPISPVRDSLLAGFAQEGETIRGYSRFSDISVTISNWALAASLWVSTNYLYLYIPGMPRFGYQPDSQKVMRFRNWLFSNCDTNLDTENRGTHPQTSATALNGVPRLNRRLKTKGCSILALVAEDHYTRVITLEHEELIYIRFSDAIEEMQGQAGLQVHRSYWVSSAAAMDYQEKGHLAFIELSNKQKIPVSRSYRQNVRQVLAGLTS